MMLRPGMVSGLKVVANRQNVSPVTKSVNHYYSGETFPSLNDGAAAVVALPYPQNGRAWRLDFGSPRYIQDFQLFGLYLIDYGAGQTRYGAWLVKGSNNLASYTTLGSGELNGGSSSLISVNTAYRYLELWQNGFASSDSGYDGFFVCNGWSVTGEP